MAPKRHNSNKLCLRGHGQRQSRGPFREARVTFDAFPSEFAEFDGFPSPAGSATNPAGRAASRFDPMGTPRHAVMDEHLQGAENIRTQHEEQVLRHDVKSSAPERKNGLAASTPGSRARFSSDDGFRSCRQLISRESGTNRKRHSVPDSSATSPAASRARFDSSDSEERAAASRYILDTMKKHREAKMARSRMIATDSELGLDPPADAPRCTSTHTSQRREAGAHETLALSGAADEISDGDASDGPPVALFSSAAGSKPGRSSDSASSSAISAVPPAPVTPARAKSSSIVAADASLRTRPTRGKAKEQMTVPLTKFKDLCYEVWSHTEKKTGIQVISNKNKKKNGAYGVSIPDTAARFLRQVTEAYVVDQFRMGMEMKKQVKAGKLLPDTIAAAAKTALVQSIVTDEESSGAQRKKPLECSPNYLYPPPKKQPDCLDDIEDEEEASGSSDDGEAEAKKWEEHDDQFYENVVKNSTLSEIHSDILDTFGFAPGELSRPADN